MEIGGSVVGLTALPETQAVPANTNARAYTSPYPASLPGGPHRTGMPSGKAHKSERYLSFFDMSDSLTSRPVRSNVRHIPI